MQSTRAYCGTISRNTASWAWVLATASVASVGYVASAGAVAGESRIGQSRAVQSRATELNSSRKAAP